MHVHITINVLPLSFIIIWWYVCVWGVCVCARANNTLSLYHALLLIYACPYKTLSFLALAIILWYAYAFHTLTYLCPCLSSLYDDIQLALFNIS
jgi:hypothetical protein